MGVWEEEEGLWVAEVNEADSFHLSSCFRCASCIPRKLGNTRLVPGKLEKASDTRQCGRQNWTYTYSDTDGSSASLRLLDSRAVGCARPRSLMEACGH